MSKKSKRLEAATMAPADAARVFHASDVLFALEWAAVAPGLGGWNVLLDDDRETRLVSVIPPGAEQPIFFIRRTGAEVALTWLRPLAAAGGVVEVGRFASLRFAVQALCPLNDEQKELANESMEILYPRALRAP